MSHFTTIQTRIRDMDALREACREMGVDLVQNAQARGYGGRTQSGEYVIRLKGPYDIALARQPDGTYGLTTDWWDGHVEKQVGANYGRLLQLCGTARPRPKPGARATPRGGRRSKAAASSW